MPIVMQRLDRSVHFAIGFWFHAVKVYILPSETVYIPKSNSMKVQITSASPNRKWTFALQNFIRSTRRPWFIHILRLDVDGFFYLFNSTFIWIIIIRNKWNVSMCTWEGLLSRFFIVSWEKWLLITLSISKIIKVEVHF